MNISINLMDKNSLIEVAAIESVCFSQPWSFENLTESFENPLYCFFAALCNDKLVGYIGGYSSGCEDISITNIAVLPKYRRLGIGNALLTSLCRHAKELGFTTVLLEVRVSNLPAISLYKSLNFEILGIRPNFYEAPTEDAYILMRKLVEN